MQVSTSLFSYGREKRYVQATKAHPAGGHFSNQRRHNQKILAAVESHKSKVKVFNNPGLHANSGGWRCS